MAGLGLACALPFPPATAAENPSPANPHHDGRPGEARKTTLLKLLEELADREKQLLGRLDYDGLLELEARRLDAITELSCDLPPAESIPGPEVIVLTPGQARLSGNVTRHDSPAGRGLTGWQEQSAASWQVEGIQPGYYAVQLVHSPPPQSHDPPDTEHKPRPDPADSRQGATPDIITCGEASHFVSNREHLLTTTFDPTRPPKDIRSLQLGVLPLTDTSADIQLRVVETGGGGIINLEAIYLLRTARPAPDPGTAGDSPAPGLDLLKDEHREAIVALREPIDQAYLEQLRELHEKLEQTGKPGPASKVREEWQQVEAARSRLVASGIPVPGKRDDEADRAAPGSGQDSDDGSGAARENTATLQTLKGCRLVGEPAAGDRFTVRHRKRQFTVRLLFVACPRGDTPPDPGLADYFGIEPAHLPTLAEIARSFTLELLRETSFNIRIAGGKNPQGSVPAIVQVPAIGSLQQLLVAEGLAAIRADNIPVPGMAYRVLVDHTLAQIESGAKKARHGAWHFQRALPAK